MDHTNYTLEPWVPYVINDNGHWQFQVRTKRSHNPAGQVGVHIAEVNRYLPARWKIIHLIANAPDLYRTSLAVVGDLQLFVSRQGPGPDRRLDDLQAVLKAITDAPELKPDLTFGVDQGTPCSQYKAARAAIRRLRDLFDDAEIHGQPVSQEAHDLLDRIREEVP